MGTAGRSSSDFGCAVKRGDWCDACENRPADRVGWLGSRLLKVCADCAPLVWDDGLILAREQCARCGDAVRVVRERPQRLDELRCVACLSQAERARRRRGSGSG